MVCLSRDEGGIRSIGSCERSLSWGSRGYGYMGSRPFEMNAGPGSKCDAPSLSAASFGVVRL